MINCGAAITHLTARLYNGTALAAPSLVAASLMFSSINVYADQSVLSGSAVTTPILLADGETLTVEGGGVVDAPGDGVNDVTNLSTVYVNNAGAIAGGSYGINVLGSTLVFSNSGTITGTTIDGILATTISGMNSNAITGTGYGVGATSTITDLTNSGTITAIALNGVLAPTINSLTNSGSILGQIDGIQANILLGNLMNSGLISGTTGHGIEGAVVNDVMNSGSITGGDDGISANTITNLTNSGQILATNDGIDAVEITNLTNSGRIFGFDDGVEATTIDSLINSGTITGAGAGGIGVFSGTTISNLINSGAIEGSNYGVYAGDTLTSLTNSGTIYGGSVAGVRIFGGSGTSTITNSGTIEGASGISIHFDEPGDADILNLEPGSILIGDVHLDGVNDTVNFAAGLSTIVSLGGNEPGTASFSSPINFSNSTTRAQADVSTQSVMGDVLSGVTSSIGNGAQTRIDAASFGGVASGFGYGTEDNAPGKTGTYWVSGWGTASRSNGSSSFAATTHVAGGGLVGADWLDENGDLYGVYGGAGVGRIRVDVKNGQETDTNSFYGGLYGKRQMGEGAITLDLLTGWMNFDSRRIVDTATATAKYNGFFFAPTLGYEKDITLGEQQMLASASVGYSGLYLGGYSETGSAGNLTVASRNIHQLNARGELAWQKEIGSGSEHVTKIQPYLGLEGSVGFGGNNATATFLGATTTFKAANSNSVARGFVGAKFNTSVSENSSIFGRLEASYDTGSTAQIGGKIGFAVKF
ncbi:autotransporter outer membrane beta-barrel domain-containing protein [Lentilitoribacter sp. Alg239-R112]|uniref:autotransporter outer membrane beta-barrel domain-containing protein n=1 Tax=Lentilitoribacter sp. Alg239-R112 TaxID=2305987 RepID=UPI0013A704C1|nr:autotransporter outer membrane beta-barrel domain-containing protein [Lentilitoribacter sp. Alg239-R112]